MTRKEFLKAAGKTPIHLRSATQNRLVVREQIRRIEAGEAIAMLDAMVPGQREEDRQNE